jgi:hypothetical protein
MLWHGVIVLRTEETNQSGDDNRSHGGDSEGKATRQLYL